MQTAPPGTYSGMVQCATGILKNEGPLAFYKVRGKLAFKIGPQRTFFFSRLRALICKY